MNFLNPILALKNITKKRRGIVNPKKNVKQICFYPKKKSPKVIYIGSPTRTGSDRPVRQNQGFYFITRVRKLNQRKIGKAPQPNSN